jgi:hypothetical protein
MLLMPGLGAPDPLEDPREVYDTITALANTNLTDWRAIEKLLRALGWKFDRKGKQPDVIAHKRFKPSPKITAYVPQAIWMEMGFSIGFTAAANIIHARQGAASTLIAPPSDPFGNLAGGCESARA